MEHQETPASPGRRKAIKIGAATAVGAAVWNEPYVFGLTRRPAYASAASVAPVIDTVTFPEFAAPFGTPTASTTSADGGTVDLTVTNLGGGGYQFDLAYTPPAGGTNTFTCTVDSGTVTGNGSGRPPITGGVIQSGGLFQDGNGAYNDGTERKFNVTITFTCTCD